MNIIWKRLEELNALLDELFLYTRIQSSALPLECERVAALPPLREALAEFYPRLEAAGVESVLCFEREDVAVWADPYVLGRVYRNLIANALRYGDGGLTISGWDSMICFSNRPCPAFMPDLEQLFERFYQESSAQSRGGGGLGLAIVRELLERMGGKASAQNTGRELQISLQFSTVEN